MKERPILFSGPMVRAILERRKTQTRRVADVDSIRKTNRQPFHVGQNLWVRETWHPHKSHSGPASYRATWDDDPHDEGWKPSIFMPRWASRITLEVTGVRVERVQEMSNEDAQAEGIQVSMDEHSVNLFADLWDSLNGKKHPWSSNPWVWVIEFHVRDSSAVVCP